MEDDLLTLSTNPKRVQKDSLHCVLQGINWW